MDSDLSIKAKLNASGYDVDALYRKYATHRNTLKGELKGDVKQIVAKSTGTRSRPEYVFCSTCAGIGIIKEVYNHQIRESNCKVCEEGGIPGLVTNSKKPHQPLKTKRGEDLVPALS